MVLVVVERGDRGRLGAGDLDEDLELQRLLALAGGEHPAAAAEERVGGDVEARRRARARAGVERAVAPRVAPGRDGLGLAEPDDLALVEHLQPRRVAATAPGGRRRRRRRRSCSRRPPAARARRSPGRRGSRRPAARTRSLIVWNSLQSSWRAGALVLLGASRLGRRRSRRSCRRGAGSSSGSRSPRADSAAGAAGSAAARRRRARRSASTSASKPHADVLEGAAAAVDAGHAARDQQPAVDRARRGTASWSGVPGRNSAI